MSWKGNEKMDKQETKTARKSVRWVIIILVLLVLTAKSTSLRNSFLHYKSTIYEHDHQFIKS